MDTIITPAAITRTWTTMTSTQKSVYVGKVCIMFCSFGFIFGGALVDGVVYPDLGSPLK